MRKANRQDAKTPRTEIALGTVAVLLLIAVSLAHAGEDDSKTQVDAALRDESWNVPPELTFRARVTALTPSEPTNIDWRWGGEGLGGAVTRGSLAEKIAVGEWSPAVPVASLVKGAFPRRLFVTFTVGRGGKLLRDGKSYGYFRTEGHSTNVEVEFEFSFRGKVVKTFKEAGPDGGTVGIVIPAYRLAGGKNPDSPEFTGELSGLLEYAAKRLARLENLPSAKSSAGVPPALAGETPAVRSAGILPAHGATLPKLFSVMTNLDGYGEGSYYGTRYTNKAIVEAECRTLRLLGVNSFAAAPRFLLEGAGTGVTKDFRRALYMQLGGYPVPRADPKQKDRADPEAGCPFAPGVETRTREMIAKGLADARNMPVDEVWWRTEDEIGAVVDRAPEGKQHLATCPRCAEGFRAYLKGLALAPADFGAQDWAQVKPLNIWGKEPLALEDAGAARTAYYSAMFNNYSSAKLFTPVRDALTRANADIEKGPRVFSFALRGNTFLMGGHSLDFFDFYRLADNAFVYETSNRDARVWSWDSYLCDVGRVVSAQQKINFGIYIKPHRGAPVQRTLSAASRGARMFYWYTYGPEYAKGDTFAESDADLQLVAKAAALLGKTESVLYNATWLKPAEIAVVTPRSSEIWKNLGGNTPAYVAAWENAKWIYSALQHAHLPVDALDEVMLATEDLSRYKVIYVNGPNLTRAAAEKLAAWVNAGGVLYSSGGGLARDEANQPLASLQAVLGLQARAHPEMFFKVSAYGSTQLESYTEAGRLIAAPPAGSEIAGTGIFSGGQGRPPHQAGPFKPIVGRELLKPAPGTDVLATFADGGAAVTRAAHGKGLAYVAGFFPGLEYSAGVRNDEFDMARQFDARLREFIAAPALEKAQPVVDASQPLVEGVLLKNNATGKRAVTLMNWAYQVTGKRTAGKKTSTIKNIVSFTDLKITLRGAGEVAKVTSAALDKALAFERSGDTVIVTLPRIDEGDVLLLE